MPHLEDAFFGKREESDELFNDYFTLGHALNMARERAFEELQRGYNTLFASVRLYEQPFITSYSTPGMILKDGKPHLMQLPVKKIIAKERNRDPRFFFALGNPDDLNEQMHYVIADISRTDDEITKFEIHQTSGNGVKGSVDEWVNKMISAYHKHSSMLERKAAPRSFENLYLTYFKDAYYLSICVKDDPLIHKLHVHPDGRMMYNSDDREHQPLITL